MRDIDSIRNLPGFKVLESFQVGNGYTFGSVASSDANATGGPGYFGPTHLQFEAIAGGATASGRHRPFADGRSVDLTGQQLAIMYGSTNREFINAFQFDAGDDTLANRYRFELLNDNQATQYALENEIVFQTLNFVDGAVTGTPDRSNITGMQLRLSALAGGNVTLNSYAICSFDEPAKAKITFSADDAYESVYTKMYPVMRKFDAPFTAYVPEFYVNEDNRLQLDQILEMKAYGAEIGGHTLGNDDRVKSDSELLAMFENQVSRMRAMGIEPQTFAYAGGEFGGNVQNLLENTPYIGARTISQTTRETYPPADPFRQRVIYPTNAVTKETIKTAIDDAVANKTLLHIGGFHNFVDGVAGITTEYNIDDFEEIVEHASSVDADIITVAQATV